MKASKWKPDRSYEVAPWLPEGQVGAHRVERFTVDPKRWQGYGPRHVPEGTYTRLMRGDTIVMSDTPDEHRDHTCAIYAARGEVLVAGLGIGMVAAEMLKRPEVTHVTVVEISEDVIALTGPHLKALYGDRLTIVHASIYDYMPPKGQAFDCMWFDVWDDINPDNLTAMKRLHRRFARRKRTPDAYVGSWARWQCERLAKAWGWRE